MAVVGSSVTGWAEFRAISKKLQRYNFVARNLQSLRLWWTRLTPVDRADLQNVDRLVSSTEDIVLQEFSQWQAGARRSEEMLQAAEEESGKKSK